MRDQPLWQVDRYIVFYLQPGVRNKSTWPLTGWSPGEENHVSRVFLIDRINPSAGVLLRGRGPMHKGMLIGLNPLIIPQDFDALAHLLCEGLIF